MKHIEYELQKSICGYISDKYPDVMFLSDTVASIKLTLPQAARNKAIQKNGFKCPDLIILEPKSVYNGLFIELKKESPYKKNGYLKTNEHLEKQEETLGKLRYKNYFACFSWSFEQTKNIIDQYMNLK